ncbi:zinc ribbon domain-containing protein [Gloeobacter violaceus]|uniref:zinc ribbon domain-containing protein n=1 Tax=Gloeobacter violaceus TaxID=33072 RepID=UPI0002FE6CC4
MFLSTLEWTCRKRGVFFARVDPKGTSQTCPQCGVHTGKKDLSVRVHECLACGYTTDRDVAAAQVLLQRGLGVVGATRAVGRTAPTLVAAAGYAVKKPVEATGIPGQ